MGYFPLLAILTGLLEVGAGVWVLISRGPGRKRILLIVGGIFLLLAGYQFAEVAVCSAPENRLWTQLAFFDITWLPPLALWLGWQLGSPGNRWMRTAALVDMALALALSVWIFADPQGITKSVCQMVVARYLPERHFDIAYGLFYQVSLLVLVFGAAAGMAHTDDVVRRKHWANLQTGLLGFLFPALAVRILVPETEGLLPSVMCHFAVVLGISLFVLVLRERRSGGTQP